MTESLICAHPPHAVHVILCCTDVTCHSFFNADLYCNLHALSVLNSDTHAVCQPTVRGIAFFKLNGWRKLSIDTYEL